MYNPKVLPDTQGYGPGITAAGNAISGALGTYAGWKRQDKTRAEDRGWAVEDREARFAQQEEMFGLEAGQEEKMFGMGTERAKALREMAARLEEEDLRKTNAGMALALGNMGVPPEKLKVLSDGDPKAANVAMLNMLKMQGHQMSLEQEAAQKRKNLELPGIPIRDETGKPRPDVGFYGPTGEAFRSKPAGATPEEAIAAGMVADQTVVDGVTYRRPKVAKDAGRKIPQMKEVEVGLNPRTGQPMMGQQWTGKFVDLPDGWVVDQMTGQPRYVGSVAQREMDARAGQAGGGAGPAAGTGGRLEQLGNFLRGVGK
jgi:hypothetical protein